MSYELARWRASDKFQGFHMVPDRRSCTLLSTLPLFYIAQSVNSDDHRVWKAITFLCGYLSLSGVVTSLCLVVTSLCLVVTSLCGLFIMWCGFVFMFCWLHFRYKALVPRLYSLLGTSQTGFTRGPSSCSSALSKITKWWEQATITFRLACEGPQTRVSYSEICCRKNWAWKCIKESCPMSSLYVLV